VGLIVLLTFAAALFVPWKDYVAPFVIRRLIQDEKRELLYHINHDALARELRKFADQMRWGRSVKHSDPESFDARDPIIPPALGILKATVITIHDDRIEYQFGGLFANFGIVVFRDGNPGTGTKKLGDGIWFYSADGKVPRQ